MPVLDIPLDSESDTIMFIPFNRPLARAETVQQSNSTRLRSSNESLMNVALRATEISASLDASSIIPEGVKYSKKQMT